MIFRHCDSSCILITEILDHWENFHRPIASLGAFDPTKIGRVGRLAAKLAARMKQVYKRRVKRKLHFY